MILSEHEVVAQVGRVSVQRLRLWVRQGWVAPSMGSTGPVYDALDVARVNLLCQLKDDFGLSDDALPLVLSLMDQLYGTRRELKLLLDAVDRLPEDMRQAVHQAHRRN